MNEDDYQNVWTVMSLDSVTGRWAIRSVHMTEDEAGSACDRETLRVIQVETAPLGTRESAFNTWAAAEARAQAAEAAQSESADGADP